MNDTVIKILSGVMFAAFLAGQTVGASRAVKQSGKFEYREKHHIAMRVFRLGIGIPWLAAIVLYFVKPAWLIWWTELTLGKNFNPTLHLREEHTLVTTGPYRWVRPPMYTAHSLLVIALLLAPANWLIGLPAVIGLAVILISREGHEEAVMIEKSGDEYRGYMKRTGRFFPRLT